MKRRHLKFLHMSDAVADARALANGYTQTGSWNLEQNLSHLNKSLQMAIDGSDWGLPKPIRPIMRWMFMGRMKRLGSDAIKMKASAPPSLQPDDELDLQFQISEFERQVNLSESPETKLVDVHPVFGRVNRQQWQIVQRWHAAHHLSFLVPTSGIEG